MFKQREKLTSDMNEIEHLKQTLRSENFKLKEQKEEAQYLKEEMENRLKK